jgi:HEPN domain-containing protein
MPFRRPRSLAEVAERARRGEDVYSSLREFLDHFYVHTWTQRAERRAMLAKPPAGLGDPIADAYLAAAAEHLSLKYRLGVPAWVHDPSRFLHQAHFAGPEGMKAMLLAESPLAFRRRMIFVGFDPLGRPLRRGRRPNPPPWGQMKRRRAAAASHTKL